MLRLPPTHWRNIRGFSVPNGSFGLQLPLPGGAGSVTVSGSLRTLRSQLEIAWALICALFYELLPKK